MKDGKFEPKDFAIHGEPELTMIEIAASRANASIPTLLKQLAGDGEEFTDVEEFVSVESATKLRALRAKDEQIIGYLRTKIAALYDGTTLGEQKSEIASLKGEVDRLRSYLKDFEKMQDEVERLRSGYLADENGNEYVQVCVLKEKIREQAAEIGTLEQANQAWEDKFYFIEQENTQLREQLEVEQKEVKRCKDAYLMEAKEKWYAVEERNKAEKEVARLTREREEAPLVTGVVERGPYFQRFGEGLAPGDTHSARLIAIEEISGQLQHS